MTNLDKQIAQTLKKVAGELDQPTFVMPDQAVTYKRKRSRLLGTLVLPVSISCALLLTVSVGSYVSPTFAAYVKSLFEGSSDKELQYAAQEGFSQKVNVSVTDQGYTLEIKEILADPMRIVAVYSIKDQQNNFIHPDKLDISKVEVTDLKGNVIKETRMFGMSRNDEKYGYLTLKNPGETKEQKLLLQFQGDQIDSVKGNWSLQIPFDLEKSITASKVLPMNGSYTTPQGLQINLNSVMYSPTAARVEYETKWTEEAKKRLVQESKQVKGKIASAPPYVRYDDYKLNFHVENEKGEKIKDLNREIATPRKYLDKYGHSIRKYGFAPLSPDHQYTLVLDSLVKTEPYKLDISFEPKQLGDKPVRVDQDGKTLEIKSVTFDKPQNEASPKDEKHATITLEAYVKDIVQIPTTILVDDDTDKIINHFDWTIKDEKGKIYNVTGGDFKMLGKDEQGRNHIRIKLQSYEMKELPQKISLTSELAEKSYDLDWRVPLPMPKEDK
ncbi:DUF4179 domain-containing protein [Brevibacillus laterosporus]|uniref:DUF4179 domain-containing protein n=1 Tax=Brevibacillus laterosporus TaxID=1465 RepID=UPI000CE39CF3|nr:DUF4179 domain-containing protein [Brevibacillus laterosporus]MED1665179.1 DUF4179 domain-containing protein [Brevibacillus laterosporus]MED1670240.1 DUF4179 domain-containing protein [Brevibacillus laterosporus]MED1718113.1 DUF4179 domain-containing protein [Brevibacillus laterosporus]PPA88106.1 DUF4179 domain-containing protein [Brevibacillus laterosporus]